MSRLTRLSWRRSAIGKRMHDTREVRRYSERESRSRGVVMSNFRKSIFVAMLIVLLSCFGSKLRAQGTPNKSAEDKEQSGLINDGDMLDVVVFEVPDLSTKVRVDEHGDVL